MAKLTKLLVWVSNFAFTLLGLAFLTFLIGRIVPIDPVITIIGENAPQAAYDRTYRELGLDQPVIVQFWRYLKGAVAGEFGTSFVTGRAVVDDIRVFFPATFELATLGMILGVLFGIPAGVAAAVWQNRWPDHIIRTVSLIGYSVPIFWLALMGLLVFYARLNWVGGPGQLDIGYQDLIEPRTGLILVDSAMAGEWDVFRNAFSHIILPATLLGYYAMAYISRMTRSVMIEQLSQEYTLTARVKGQSEFNIVVGHALRNAAIPLVTILALSYAGLLEGSVLIETVFAWPGLGNYIASSLLSADMNAVLGGTLLVGAIFVSLNLLADALYKLLDPRS